MSGSVEVSAGRRAIHHADVATDSPVLAPSRRRAGELLSRPEEASGPMLHVLKEASGSASSATLAELAAEVAVCHTVTSIGSLASTLASEPADASGRKKYRARHFVLDVIGGSLWYLDDSKALIGLGPSGLVDSLAPRAFTLDPASTMAWEEYVDTHDAGERLVFPAGEVSQAWAKLPLPNSTQVFRFKIRLLLSTPVATGTAKLVIGYRDVRPGDALDTAEDGTESIDWTSPGSGVLSDPSSDFARRFRVESGSRLFRLRVARLGTDAGDTLAGPVHFHGLRFEQLSMGQDAHL